MIPYLLAKRNVNFSLIVTCFVTILFVVFVPDCYHWFVIPSALCGFLVGLDAANWFYGSYDTFDVYGFSGVYGFFFFLIAPLLTIAIGYEPRFIPDLPKDWRPWFGIMACLNLCGLSLYYSIRTICDKRTFVLKTVWYPSPRNSFLALPIFLALSLALQILFWIKTGGIGAFYLDVDLTGMGFLFLFSESFPFLIFISFLIYLRVKDKSLTLAQFVFLLFCLVLIVFVFKGLRGSRSNFIWTVVSILIVLNMTQFRIRKMALVLLLIPFFVFMTIYGLYKDIRGDIVNIDSYNEYSELSEKSGRNWKSTLVGDMGRSDIQALLCYRLLNSNNYNYAYGETYLAALILPIPKTVRPTLRSKSNAGADILYGQNNILRGPSAQIATRIYGLAGEGMLNFGLAGGVMMFIPYAFVISWVRRFQYALNPDDLRCFIFPALFGLSLQWSSDLDNFVFGFVKNYAFIILVVYFVKRKTYIRTR